MFEICGIALKQDNLSPHIIKKTIFKLHLKHAKESQNLFSEYIFHYA